MLYIIQLTTSNYAITTCPRDEYDITTGLIPCPEEQLFDKSGR
jgi:hypothetical protein